MTHFKGWVQALTGAVAMCVIMLGLVVVACAAVAAATVWLIGS